MAHGEPPRPVALAPRHPTTADEAKSVICELGRRFYDLGWVSGTGGGISLRVGERVFMAPSGVQKELLAPEMIYELDRKGDVCAQPSAPGMTLTVSQCRPLFLAAMELRDAGAVIHSHSKAAALATMMYADRDRLYLTKLEMLKGLSGVGFDDVHEVPIVENTPHEADLTDRLRAAIEKFPRAHAVLVRRHGVYVWGKDWLEAKRHAECYDYLFDIAVDMKRLGL